jgi:cell division protein FtsB
VRVLTLQLKAKPADTTASVDAEKKLRGFQHIIQELSAENAELKERSESLEEEITLLKEVRSAYAHLLEADLVGGQVA